jgi:hypothetical protein
VTLTRHRPAAAWTTAGVLVFLGVSASARGVAMVFGIGPPLPPDWLDAIPLIDSWVVPGVVLGVGFGLGSLLVAYGVLRRPGRFAEGLTGRHWSWLATVLIGGCQVVWIGLELIFLPQLSVLEAVYGGVGVALVLLPTRSSVRAYLAAPPGNGRPSR